jgi:hypothetical protein
VAWVAHNLAHSNHTESAKCNDTYKKPGSIADQEFLSRRKRIPDGRGPVVKVVEGIDECTGSEIRQVEAEFLRRSRAV